MQSEIRSLQLNLQEFVSDKPQLFTNTPAEGLLPPVPITPSPDFVQISQNLVRCFRSGFSTSDHWPWVPCSEEGQEQINFVQRTLHPEVLVGDLHGPNAFLEQWRHFTAFFGSLSLHGHSFELLNHSAGLAVCRAQLTLSLRLIDETLQHVLPHLLHPQHSELKERLLGKQIHVAMTMLLQFDPLGRVCSYDSLLDLVTAFRPLVSSYEDVEIVLSGARISSYGSISQAVGTATAKPDGRLALAFVLSPMDDE
ncbi:hypothetical protein PHYBOEH_008742 [Phytophthora boehmeriae]|uniref:Bzip transcription factor n=1 Tax=Phytophthora boehmeriae TaxID=109152 RepID=A0A8T1X016_9STRA|nr:hypothetical protein PHYBOEH_008742 [Phytophthora boehmeriae]